MKCSLSISKCPYDDMPFSNYTNPAALLGKKLIIGIKLQTQTSLHIGLTLTVM